MKSRNLPKMTRDTRKKKIQTFHNDDDRNAIDGWRPSILKKLAEKHAIQYGFWFDIYHLRFVCFESFWIQVGFLFLVHHRSIGSRPKTHAYIFHIFHYIFNFAILDNDNNVWLFSGPGSMHLNNRLCGPGFFPHIQSIIDDHRDRIEYQTAFDYGSNSSSIQFWWGLFVERRRIHTLIGYLFISTMLLLFQKSTVDWNALLLNELLPFTYSKMVSVLPRFRPHHRTHTNHSDFYVV